MDVKKEFKIASIVLLFLGVLDVILIAMDWLTPESPLGEKSILLFVLFAVMCIIVLAKLYMGIMGLKYCMGTGKGRLHISLAKIGVVLAVIAVVISVIDMISGAGTIQTVISDGVDVMVIHWYFNLAKKNYN